MTERRPLTWVETAARFDAARNWWVNTSGPRGPHAVPVWGVVVQATLMFYGSQSAVRSRNLALDPRLVVHLEDGDSPTIVHGSALLVGPAAGHAAAVTAYARKYPDPGDRPYLPDAPGMASALLFVVEPGRAVTWDLDDFENSQRRWRSA